MHDEEAVFFTAPNQACKLEDQVADGERQRPHAVVLPQEYLDKLYSNFP